MSGTPEQALATGRRQVDLAEADLRRGQSLLAKAPTLKAQAKAQKIIAGAERSLRHLRREVRRLETEVNVASLQASLVPSMPSPLAQEAA